MSQSTALATSTGTRALARFGSEEDIKMLMMRQATIFGIEPAEVNRPDVQASLIKATQYSITYGYLPGIHIHMMPFNKKVKGRNGQDEWIKSYEPALGEKAWKDSADKSAQVQGFKYLVETQEMTPEEVKRHTAADPTAEYTEGDAGFKARVLRSDHAEIYRMMGRQYDPEWSYGFWRKKAKKNYKGQWISDETPNQRGPRDVAERRAYKSALMKVFSLLPLNEFDEARRFKSLATYVEDETAVDRTLMAPPAALHYDDDGLLLHGESPVDGHYRAVDAGTGEIYDDVPPANPSAEIDFGMGQEEDDGPADAIEKQLDKMHQRFNGQDRPRVDYDADADFDSIPGQGASVTAKYAGLINSLVGPSREFADWCRKKHSESDFPATEAQYRYLGATINAITGDPLKGSHYAVLEVLTGRPTNSDNPPGYDLAKALLDWLPEMKGKGAEKQPNPTHQKKYADCVGVIWQVIQSGTAFE